MDALWLPLAALLAAGAVLAWPRSGAEIVEAAAVADPARSAARSSKRSRWLTKWLAPATRSRGTGTRGPRGRRDRARALADVLTVLDLVAAALHAGAVPNRAVALAAGELADSSPVRACLERPVASLHESWRHVATVTGSPEVDLVARAWQLSEQLGVPLAQSVDTAAHLVRRSIQLGNRVDTALASPRATMRLLTTLPVVGPLVGWLFGLDPARLYLDTAPARVTAVVGLALFGGGWLWSRALTRGVCRS